MISVNTELLDFGPVPLGQRVARKITVLNSGDLDLEIAGVALEQDFAAFSSPSAPGTIERSGETVLTVSFEPTLRKRYRASLVIESSAANISRKVIELLGEGVLACDGVGCPDAGQGTPDAGTQPDAADGGTKATDAATPRADGGRSEADAGIDGGAQDAAITACGAPEGAVKWTYAVGGPGVTIFSHPAIGRDGTVYFGTGQGKLVALRPDGTLRWTYDTGSGSLIATAPAIDDNDTIYFGSYDDHLHAVDRTGTKRWAFKTSGDVNSSPAIGADGTIYVGSADGKLYAITASGARKWAYDAGAYLYSSPAVGPNGVVYVGTKFPGRLLAINADGTLRFSYSVGADVDSSPAIGADGTLYVGADDGKVHAIGASGAQRWVASTGGLAVDSSPALAADGTAYVGSWNDRVHALSPGGALRWSFATTATVGWSSPTVGADGTLYIGTKDAHQIGTQNRLLALRPDGTLRWALAVPAFIDTSPTLAPDGTLYFGTWNGTMYAVCTGSLGLGRTPWPKMRHDARNTGRLPACHIDIEVQCGRTPGFPASYAIAVRDSDPGRVTFTEPGAASQVNFCTTGVGPLNLAARSGVITASYELGACQPQAHALDNTCAATKAYSCP
jgi:outer membrane protein assembly factor BamB